VESCIGHIKHVIDLKKTKNQKLNSKNMDADVLNEVLIHLTKLQTRLKSRYKNAKEKLITCLMCCGTGGCCDLTKIQRTRKHRRAKKSKLYHMADKKVSP
jgi:hypothetical protein